MSETEITSCVEQWLANHGAHGASSGPTGNLGDIMGPHGAHMGPMVSDKAGSMLPSEQPTAAMVAAAAMAAHGEIRPKMTLRAV